eukprot:COSAG05_NODE_49_length_24373_cov_16.162561_21_plen_106_part_00
METIYSVDEEGGNGPKSTEDGGCEGVYTPAVVVLRSRLSPPLTGLEQARLRVGNHRRARGQRLQRHLHSQIHTHTTTLTHRQCYFCDVTSCVLLRRGLYIKPSNE